MHVVLEFNQKRALLCGLPKGYDVTVESVMNFKHKYIEFVSKLILCETRLCNA